MDGDQHGTDSQMARDAARTMWLEARGYSVLRFANHEVLRERSRVMEVIVHALENTPHPRQSKATASTSSSRGEVKDGT